MPESVRAPDAAGELRMAEGQGPELWAQSEQLAEAYRAAARRADDLRLCQLGDEDQLQVVEPVTGVLSSV
jgi:hypothetical protein